MLSIRWGELFALKPAVRPRIPGGGSTSVTAIADSVLIASNTLKNVIAQHNLPLGNTPTGRDWCLKALHPADPLTEVRGIPDKSAVPSVFLNYQTVYTLSPAQGATGTWSFDGQLIPHPIVPLAINKTDSQGLTVHEVLNSQLTGASHYAKYQTFYDLAKRWRLAYLSVTVYQDGPDLANQGTIVVCQKPLVPRKFNVSSYRHTPVIEGIGDTVLLSRLRVAPHISVLDTADVPLFDSSQGMPNAYFTKSREGAYVPLKLTKTCQRWTSRQDDIYQATSAQRLGDPFDGQFELAPNPNPPGSQITGYYPFTSLGEATCANDGAGSNTGELIGEPTSDFLNDVWADISVRNVAVTTSFSFFIRMGLEVQVQPWSALAPHQKLSPPHDTKAISNYFQICREMKDAYPADYNDAGKIWSIISGIAKTVAPALSAIPIVGPFLAAGVPAAAVLGDNISSAVERAKSSKNERQLASQADLDHVRTAIAAADTLVAKASVPPELVPRAPEPTFADMPFYGPAADSTARALQRTWALSQRKNAKMPVYGPAADGAVRALQKAWRAKQARKKETPKPPVAKSPKVVTLSLVELLKNVPPTTLRKLHIQRPK